MLFQASGLEQQPSRPPPAAEAGRRGWGRALIFQSLAKRLQKKSASATRQGGISAVTKATVRLWLARGSQRPGTSTKKAAVSGVPSAALFLSRKNFVELELNDGVQPVEPLSFEQDARMSFQSEPLQVFQIRTNHICQKPPGRGDEIRTEPGRTMVDAPFRLSQLLTVQIEQETAVIVEDRSHSLHLHRVIVVQDAEIPAVAVGVQDERIQNAHPPESVPASDALKIPQKTRNRAVFGQHSGFCKAVLLAGEKRTL